MIKWKTIRDLFLVVIALLFLPYNNRLLMFDTRPEDWYGELTLAKDGEVFIFAKNSSTEKVSTNLPGKFRRLLQRFDQPDVLEVKDGTEVLPLSYSLVVGAHVPANISKRHVNIKGEYFFRPGPLTVSTVADYYTGFALIGVTLVCFVLLTYSVSSYVNEKSAAFLDKSPTQ